MLKPPEISFNDLKQPHTSHPRNPRIINVFYRRGFIEAMGIGTQEIIKSSEEANMSSPEFFEQAGNFCVRLWSRHYQRDIDSGNLSEKQKLILEAMGDDKLSPAEILENLKGEVPERTLRRELNRLKDKGYIDSEGEKGWKRKWFIMR